MKLFIHRLLCSIALAALSTSVAHAQQRALTRPASPQPRDPFLKERGAPATPPDTSENLTSLTIVFETFAASPNGALTLLSSPADSAARYAKVGQLVAEKKARLANFQACAAKSGLHSVIESLDVVQLAMQFYPALRKEDAPIAAMLSEARFGARCEFDAILGPDGRSCNLNFSSGVDRLLGFRPYKMNEQGQPQASAATEKRQIVTSVAVRTGEPIFLGTLSPALTAGGERGEIWLLFGRVLVSRERPEAVSPAVGQIGYAEHLIYLYSMERGAAQAAVLASGKPGGAFAAVRALGEKGQAALEHIVSVPSQAGVRATSDENIVAKQPGGASPLVALAQIGAFRDSAERRASGPVPYVPSMTGKNLGLGVELDSVVGPADAVIKGLPLAADLNITLFWRDDMGNLKAEGVAPLYPESGVVESRKLQTSIACYAGVTSLLGTLNPPESTGVNERKASDRVWLAFVRVSPVKP